MRVLLSGLLLLGLCAPTFAQDLDQTDAYQWIDLDEWGKYFVNSTTLNDDDTGDKIYVMTTENNEVDKDLESTGGPGNVAAQWTGDSTKQGNPYSTGTVGGYDGYGLGDVLSTSYWLASPHLKTNGGTHIAETNHVGDVGADNTFENKTGGAADFEFKASFTLDDEPNASLGDSADGEAWAKVWASGQKAFEITVHWDATNNHWDASGGYKNSSGTWVTINQNDVGNSPSWSGWLLNVANNANVYAETAVEGHVFMDWTGTSSRYDNWSIKSEVTHEDTQ